ncbi:transposase [Teichococcus vastitatis]|uniref:transposase n=1 Tax=Teichococcus vastitatis TaxID=2307076 RepID=UPI0038CF7483
MRSGSVRSFRGRPWGIPAVRAQLARGTIPYAPCLTNAEWALVQPFMPPLGKTGRPRRWPMRLIMDSILYVLRTGCAWTHLPCNFPPPSKVLR